MTDKDWVKHNLDKWNSIKPYDQIGIVANWLMYEDPGIYEHAKSIDDIFELYKFINIDCDCNFLSDVFDNVDKELDSGEEDTLELIEKFNENRGYDLIDISEYN